jgi:4,5-DOPA dioxygenase extradiol
MPVVFVGHGSPLNAVEDNEFSRGWTALARALPRPKAVLCISAHWETSGTYATAMAHPRTIHDFYGFPQELYRVQYFAPGAPELARSVAKLVEGTTVHTTMEWGLDHGAWSVVRRMYPAADVRVVQLSLDKSKDAAWHYALGRELSPLRGKGVLILGSGNLVHNLQLVDWEGGPLSWAVDFDALAREAIQKGDHERLVHYDELGRTASLSIPTNEHYLPLLYALGASDPGEKVRFFNEQVVLGSISMRGVVLGE